MSRKARVTSNIDCFIETGGRLKVTGSHVHCKCGSISETGKKDSDVVTVVH